MINSLINTCWDLFFPVYCRVCSCKLNYRHRDEGYICADCWSSVQIIRPPYCHLCGHPGGVMPRDGCKTCATINTPQFNMIRAVSLYDGIIRKAIHLLKYEFRQEMAGHLARMLRDYYLTCNDYPGVDVIIPVPLHRARFKYRDFNQSELLSIPLSQAIKIPINNDILYRTRHNPPQVDLSAEERFLNVIDLFAVKNAGMIQGKSILLIDDVVTTGATINACAHALRTAGSGPVYALVLARGR